MILRLKLICIVLSLTVFSCLSQNTKALSGLIKQLNTTKSDSAKVFYLNEISKEYATLNNDSSLKYAEIALAQASKLNFVNGIITANYSSARVHYFKAEYSLAKNELESLIMTYANKTPYAILQKEYNLLGAVHFNLGNYKKSEENYMASLK